MSMSQSLTIMVLICIVVFYFIMAIPAPAESFDCGRFSVSVTARNEKSKPIYETCLARHTCIATQRLPPRRFSWNGADELWYRGKRCKKASSSDPLNDPL
jgi:hypothetical protein